MGKKVYFPQIIATVLVALCMSLYAADVQVNDSFFTGTDGDGRAVYSDSRTSDYSGGSTGGLTATYPWNGGRSTLSWDISKGIDGDPAAFHYVYTLDVYRKALSHAILEVSSTFTQYDLVDLNVSDSGFSLEGPKWFLSSSSSNPGMPDNVYGIKFDGLDTKYLTIDFWSDRVPVWGDFYAKDGYSSYYGFVYLYNHDFGKDPMLVGMSNEVLNNYLGFVPRPDTHSVSVPEPATWTLIGAGMGAAALARRRRRKATKPRQAAAN